MKIAIAGYGIEGEASYRYWNRSGNELTILDANQRPSYQLPEGTRTILGEHAFDHLEEYDMVIRTPSLPPQKLAGASKVWSATNEFLAKCPAPIIGVTGTKGKGTTCTLIATILRDAGKKVHLVGNIGTPALDVLNSVHDSDIVVFEMSSFQLWDLERSPHIAVVLMVEPDHLNIHKDFEDYSQAKANIAAHQREEDIVIYHPSDPTSSRIANLSPAHTKLRYLTSETAHIEEKSIKINEQIICSVDEVGLTGEYNLQNVCAAISASWYFTKDKGSIANSIKSFKGLPHRLEFVSNKRGITFYNDSFSSAPTATMAAITAFEHPIVLILGGYDKKVDLEPLVQTIVESDAVKFTVLIGEVREALANIFREKGAENFEVCSDQNMQTILSAAMQHAQSGDVVLLSPGFASFDMFANFTERGELFKQAVRGLNE
jgi:UDP-N-acetylmuramoylalanine--D-glutamate ligase